ncbi:hypothetical protein M426DRAFT_27733 [Hypoxylon sp. CI-4A]|nr:hypothetical protein M426DRAFT_27733 [Hypoxylon sp. CI-4A]
MKPTTIFAMIASSGCLGMTNTNNQPAVLVGPKSVISPPTLEKRDAFTCYGTTNTSVSDCQKIMDSIRTDAQQDIVLYSDICAVWNEGSCRVRFCAQPYIARPIKRSADWLTTYIASPLLDGCISQGNMGVIGDNPNINGHSGGGRDDQASVLRHSKGQYLSIIQMTQYRGDMLNFMMVV